MYRFALVQLIPSQQDINGKGLGAVPELLGNLISYALFFAGALAVIFILVGAARYALSGGNPQATADAKKTITNAIIGLVLAILALVIVKFAQGLFG